MCLLFRPPSASHSLCSVLGTVNGVLACTAFVVIVLVRLHSTLSKLRSSNLTSSHAIPISIATCTPLPPRTPLTKTQTTRQHDHASPPQPRIPDHNLGSYQSTAATTIPIITTTERATPILTTITITITRTADPALGFPVHASPPGLGLRHVLRIHIAPHCTAPHRIAPHVPHVPYRNDVVARRGGLGCCLVEVRGSTTIAGRACAWAWAWVGMEKGTEREKQRVFCVSEIQADERIMISRIRGFKCCED